jgi:hypothetical protein
MFGFAKLPLNPQVVVVPNLVSRITVPEQGLERR